MDTKTCTKCGIEKSVEDFYIMNKLRGYRNGKCKDCQKKDQKEVSIRRRDGIEVLDTSNKRCVRCDGTVFDKQGRCKACMKEKHKKFQRDNPGYSQKWAENNREKCKEKAQRYREKHREKYLECKKRSRAIYAESIKKYMATYREANKDKIADQRKQYVENNKPRYCVYANNRRARKAQSAGTLSPDIGEKLFALQKGKCACCGKKLGDDYHLDHIIPLALGGSNEDSNMQLLTARCNLRKWKKHPIDYMQSKGFLL